MRAIEKYERADEASRTSSASQSKKESQYQRTNPKTGKREAAHKIWYLFTRAIAADEQWGGEMIETAPKRNRSRQKKGQHAAASEISLLRFPFSRKSSHYQSEGHFWYTRAL